MISEFLNSLKNIYATEIVDPSWVPDPLDPEAPPDTIMSYEKSPLALVWFSHIISLAIKRNFWIDLLTNLDTSELTLEPETIVIVKMFIENRLAKANPKDAHETLCKFLYAPLYQAATEETPEVPGITWSNFTVLSVADSITDTRAAIIPLLQTFTGNYLSTISSDIAGELS